MTSPIFKESSCKQKSILISTIKFELQHYLSYDKIFKTRPHLPMFVRYFKTRQYLLFSTNKNLNITTTTTTTTIIMYNEQNITHHEHLIIMKNEYREQTSQYHETNLLHAGK